MQKLTLLDYPGRTACTLFTPGCNFRCPFCHNASLVLPGGGEGMDCEEVLTFLRKRAGVLDGVCVSGGEPLLQPGLAGFLGEIKALGYRVKLDTNGSLPDRLAGLVSSGLIDYVAMDVKNSPARYAETAGCPVDLGAVGESVAFLLSGATESEFRTTVVRELHTQKDLAAIGEWIRGTERYYLQSFVDSGDLLGRNLTAWAPEDMESAAKSLRSAGIPARVRGI